MLTSRRPEIRSTATEAHWTGCRDPRTLEPPCREQLRLGGAGSPEGGSGERRGDLLAEGAHLDGAPSPSRSRKRDRSAPRAVAPHHGPLHDGRDRPRKEPPPGIRSRRAAPSIRPPRSTPPDPPARDAHGPSRCPHPRTQSRPSPEPWLPRVSEGYPRRPRSRTAPRGRGYGRCGRGSCRGVISPASDQKGALQDPEFSDVRSV